MPWRLFVTVGQGCGRLVAGRNTWPDFFALLDVFPLFMPNEPPMNKRNFVQLRHKNASRLDRPRQLIVACPPMRSNVNLSRIVRAAACCGIQKIICCGASKVIAKIARDGLDEITIENHRTLLPVLQRLREEGFELVGLEQTTGSESAFDIRLRRKMVLVVGNERTGIDEEILQVLDRTVEIPVYGLPYSHNAATAAVMALYEYCRQFPRG